LNSSETPRRRLHRAAGDWRRRQRHRLNVGNHPDSFIFIIIIIEVNESLTRSFEVFHEIRQTDDVRRDSLAEVQPRADATRRIQTRQQQRFIVVCHCVAVGR